MTQIDVFSLPFSYWVGMDTDPRTPSEALAEFNHFYSTTHVGEVVAAHPGFVGGSRYELVATESPHTALSGPRWLAVYGMADEAAAVQYLKDNERPWLHRRKYSPWPPARKRAKTVWRMLWRSTASTGSLTRPTELALLLGLNDAPELAVLPGYGRATCLELYRGFEPKESGAPRVCVIHESDREQSPTDLPSTRDERVEAQWRLQYRRIPLPE